MGTGSSDGGCFFRNQLWKSQVRTVQGLPRPQHGAPPDLRPSLKAGGREQPDNPTLPPAHSHHVHPQLSLTMHSPCTPTPDSLPPRVPPRAPRPTPTTTAGPARDTHLCCLICCMENLLAGSYSSIPDRPAGRGESVLGTWPQPQPVSACAQRTPPGEGVRACAKGAPARCSRHSPHRPAPHRPGLHQ